MEAQTVMMSQRVEDILRAEETMQIERQDIRHQLQTMASMAQREDCAALLDYIGSAQEKLTAVEPKHYCNNPALDAVLVNAAVQVEQMNISMEIKIGLPSIICKSVTHPRFMIEISNPYVGDVVFGQQGIPVTDKPGHGIGTRSIVAFAEKHNALYRFWAENGWFKLQIAM